MTTARDIRAMSASVEKSMQRVRSSRGAEIDADDRKKVREDLVEDVTDANALIRVAKRTKVDHTRLS